MAETTMQSAALAAKNNLLGAVYNAVLDALEGEQAFGAVCEEVMAARYDYKPASVSVQIPISERKETA